MDIKRVMKGIDSVDNEEIPDQDNVVKRLQMLINNKEINDIDSLTMLIKSNMKLNIVTDENINHLLWEMIIRVIHATIGNKVRRYRRQTLLRLNTVAFRTELAVKSEHK